MDLYPDAGARLSIIATIYDCGIATEIKKAASMDELTLSAYVARLEDSYGYSPRLSKECLKLWGEVYGIAAPVDESRVLEEQKKLYINPADFEIKNGVLEKYKGSGGKVIIPDSVKSFGNYAFSGCKSLTNITIPNSVTNIGDRAFEDCKSLRSIKIPSSVTSIGAGAFSGCRNLTSITIPDSVTSIGNNAFYGCSSLRSITIPDSVTSIGAFAFSHCKSLTSITLPNSVTSIDNGAFEYCGVGLTIYGVRGSYAGRYAIENIIHFDLLK